MRETPRRRAISTGPRPACCRAKISCAAGAAGRRHWQRFDGLATLDKAWLNGEPLRVTTTDEMIDAFGTDELVVRFPEEDTFGTCR